MRIKKFTFNPFQVNTYLLYNDEREAIVIDPGMINDKERSEILSYIKENRLKINYLLNTHLHLDHILGNKCISDSFNVKAIASAKDVNFIHKSIEYAEIFGLMDYYISGDDFEKKIKPNIDSFIDSKGLETIKIKDIQLDIIEIPGHTIGHLAFVDRKNGICFSGDSLFKGSVGRTDISEFDKNKMHSLL